MLYEAECVGCSAIYEYHSSMDGRHENTPVCNCGEKTRLIISAVRGFVKFPAAGGQGYVSETTGKYIDTERARRDDLKRSNCRPWEGMEQETKEAKRRQKYLDDAQDKKIDETIDKIAAQLPSEQKQALGVI